MNSTVIATVTVLTERIHPIKAFYSMVGKRESHSWISLKTVIMVRNKKERVFVFCLFIAVVINVSPGGVQSIKSLKRT